MKKLILLAATMVMFCTLAKAATMPQPGVSFGGNNVFTGTNRFTGTVIITNAASTISGNGAGLTNLSAANIASGSLADARLSANVPLLNANNTFSGSTNTFTGSLWATNSAAWIKNIALGDTMVSGSSSIVISRNSAAGLLQFANSASSKNVYLQWATTSFKRPSCNA